MEDVMGQRLNIEFIDNDDNCVANCYFHWDAYTEVAMQHLENIIFLWKENKDWLSKKSLQYQAIYLLTRLGAGIISDDLNLVEDPELKIEAVSRNNGLICISEKQIENTRSWEEGRVTINLIKETFNFDVFFSFTEEDLIAFSAEQGEDTKEEFNNATIIKSSGSFDDAVALKTAIVKSEFYKEDDIYYQKIW